MAIIRKNQSPLVVEEPVNESNSSQPELELDILSDEDINAKPQRKRAVKMKVKETENDLITEEIRDSEEDTVKPVVKRKRAIRKQTVKKIVPSSDLNDETTNSNLKTEPDLSIQENNLESQGKYFLLRGLSTLLQITYQFGVHQKSTLTIIPLNNYPPKLLT